jgi:hypothetical protein
VQKHVIQLVVHTAFIWHWRSQGHALTAPSRRQFVRSSTCASVADGDVFCCSWGTALLDVVYAIPPQASVRQQPMHDKVDKPLVVMHHMHPMLIKGLSHMP